MAFSALRACCRTPSSIVLLVVAAAALAATAHAQTEPTAVAVCPAAKWKSLPFLAKKTPADTITGLVKNFNVNDLINFAKTDILPKMGGNIFFFAVSALLLLMFILWRLFRWCCVMCCCKERCVARRGKHDPVQVLFGRRMMIVKGILGLFGLLAAIFAFYGMGAANKGVLGGVWVVVGDMTTFATNVTTQVDNLLGSISNISTAVGDFQNVVRNDLDVPGFRTNLTAIKTFLDGLGDVPTMSADVAALSTALTTTIPALVTALNNEVTAFSTPQGNLNTWLNAIKDAPTLLSGNAQAIQNRAQDIRAKANVIRTQGAAPPTNDIMFTDMQTSISNAKTVTTMLAELDALDAALVGVAGLQNPAANNPYTKLKDRLDALVNEVNAVPAKVTTVATKLTNSNALFTTASPSLNWTVAKMASINDTVLVLSGDLATSANKLNAAVTDINAFFLGANPPEALATQMTNNVGTLAPVAGAAAVQATIGTFATDFGNLAGYSGTPLADYRADVLAVRNAVDAMKTNIDTITPLLVTYINNDNTVWAALQTAATNLWTSSGTVDTTVTTVTGAPNRPGSYSTAANVFLTNNGGAAPYPTLFDAATLINPLVTAINAGLAVMPVSSVASSNTQLAGVSTQVTAMGSPPSAIVTSTLTPLNTIWDAAITQGDAVKQQITGTVSSFRGSTGKITDLVGQLNKTTDSGKKMTDVYDGYRYSATVGLYAASVGFLALFGASVAVNYHFGATFFTLLLNIIGLLFLLLGVVIGLLLVLLGDVCPAVETIILTFVPANMKGVVEYILYGTGGSIKAVLKSAGIADVDAMLAQTTASQRDVVATLTGSYTFRAGPAAIVSRITGSITGVTTGVDALLGSASYEAISPIYTGIKSFLCCTLADTFGGAWVALTMAGIFGIFLIITSWVYISRIDSVPRIDACGCSWHTKGRYAPAVAPPHGAMSNPGAALLDGMPGDSAGEEGSPEGAVAVVINRLPGEALMKEGLEEAGVVTDGNREGQGEP